MKVEEAIEFLENERGTHTEDLTRVKYRVYDEDFSFYVNSDKELIAYAEEQKNGVDE